MTDNAQVSPYYPLRDPADMTLAEIEDFYTLLYPTPASSYLRKCRGSQQYRQAFWKWRKAIRELRRQAQREVQDESGR